MQSFDHQSDSRKIIQQQREILQNQFVSIIACINQIQNWTAKVIEFFIVSFIKCEFWQRSNFELLLIELNVVESFLI